MSKEVGGFFFLWKFYHSLACRAWVRQRESSGQPIRNLLEQCSLKYKSKFGARCLGCHCAGRQFDPRPFHVVFVDKVALGQVFWGYFYFFLVTIISPMLRIQISFIYRRRYIILAVESIVKWYTSLFVDLLFTLYGGIEEESMIICQDDLYYATLK
jgi:hypothetical protein